MRTIAKQRDIIEAIRNFIINENMKMLKRTFILISIILNIGCDKEEITQRPMSETDIWNCYTNSEWTELKIRTELIGRWKWIYSENFWAPDKGRNAENENTVIEFLSDSTLNVIVGGELQNSTKWIVTSKDGELYGLELDAAVTTLLYGRILICDEIVEFNNSYIDGSDNYFKKIE